MKISEVSKKFDISQHTLRYYEERGLIPPIRKNKSGIRDYGETDLKWIEFIKCMRIAGVAIDVLSEYTELYMQGEETIEIRSDILIEQRNKLIDKVEDIKKSINKLNFKIEVHKNAIIKKEFERMAKKI